MHTDDNHGFDIPEIQPFPETQQPPRSRSLLERIRDKVQASLEAKMERPEPEPEAPQVIETFPADFGKCLELLTRLDNEPPAKGKAAELKRIGRLTALRAHVHRIQQSPEPPIFDANAQAELRKGAAQAAAQAQQELEKFKHLIS